MAGLAQRCLAQKMRMERGPPWSLALPKHYLRSVINNALKSSTHFQSFLSSSDNSRKAMAFFFTAFILPRLRYLWDGMNYRGQSRLMLFLDIINTMLVSMPRPSRKLRTSRWERPKVSILRTITCDRFESQRHDIVAPSETAPSCSARCGFRCTTSSSPAASRWCFPGKIKQLREIVVRRMQHNL